MGTSATTKVNRKNFGLNGGGGMVGDGVAITMDLELVSPVAAK
jgi:polyisoprenoid-binding protein YceI